LQRGQTTLILAPIPHPDLPPPKKGTLGDKKRRKAMSALKESDVALIVVDCARHATAAAATIGATGARTAWSACCCGFHH
jgi:hypothetical protein